MCGDCVRPHAPSPHGFAVVCYPVGRSLQLVASERIFRRARTHFLYQKSSAAARVQADALAMMGPTTTSGRSCNDVTIADESGHDDPEPAGGRRHFGRYAWV